MPTFIAVASRDRTINKAKVGDVDMPVLLPQGTHVLVGKVTRHAVEGSWAFGSHGTATATLPRSILDFPQQFYERYY